MATPAATLPRSASGAREIPHTVSPGLWTLAWRRLRADGVGMVSLAIVLAFVLPILGAVLGVVQVALGLQIINNALQMLGVL